MIQTIVVIVLVIADIVLALLHYPNWLRVARIIPNAPGIGVTHFALMAVVGTAFVLIWLAGLADRLAFMRRIRARLDERDAALHAMGEEMLRMKAACYDQERPPLEDIRTRLEAMEQDLHSLRARDESGIGIGADQEREQVPVGGHSASV
ncbi:MAG TPA: hypothetical protein VFW01_00860 [bacterium]|nr:hypothetical protein [bacterium]